MTEHEWEEITVVMLAYWPNREIPNESFDAWFMDLSEFEAEHVEAGVRALARDGREWMPNGGQIRQKIIELRQGDRPDWSAAYELAMQAASSHGGYEYGGLTWLRDNHPLTAAVIERYGWFDFCQSRTTSDGTRRAQFRDLFNTMTETEDRRERYAGLPSVERPAVDGPRPLGELLSSTERKAA